MGGVTGGEEISQLLKYLVRSVSRRAIGERPFPALVPRARWQLIHSFKVTFPRRFPLPMCSAGVNTAGLGCVSLGVVLFTWRRGLTYFLRSLCF